MLIEHRGKRPTVPDSAYVAPNAVVCGEVRLGEDARVLFGAVVTAEGGPVEIGESTIVMEQAVVRGRERHSTSIGDHVIVGPHAHVNGATVEDEAFPRDGLVGLHGGARRRGRRGPHQRRRPGEHAPAAEGLVPIG